MSQKKQERSVPIVDLTPAQRDIYAMVPGRLEWVSTNDIVNKLQYSRATVLHALKKLHNLHLVHRKIGNPYMWTRR